MSKRIKFPVFISSAIFMLFLSCPVKATILETLDVNSYAPGYQGPPPVTSTTILNANEWYIFEVSGTFGYDSADSLADAEWARDYTWPPETWVEQIGNPPDLDLLVNETEQDWMGTTDSVITDISVFSAHTYSPTHVYRLHWLGAGEAVTFRIEDGPSLDNDGFLEVKIVPEPATLLLLGLGGLALRRKYRAK
jgi:hypothetical protein